MRRYLLLITCFLFIKVNAQTDSLYVDEMKRDGITNLNSINSCQRQTITTEQIRMSGYTRPSDLIQLIDAYTFSTINGDRWYVQSNGTSYQNQDWVLMVNGQRVELERFDAVHLNMLGINITDIERIEIVNTPILYLGEFADKGLIHIITKKSYTGLSYCGYYSQGNETGDPGPYRYTPYTTANVDRIGVNTSHSLGFRKNNFSVNGTFTYQEYYARDSNIVNRYMITAPAGSDPKNSLWSGRLEMNWKTKRLSQQLQGTYTETRDFFYNPVATFELITDRSLINGGYLAEFDLSTKSKIRFSTNLSYEKTDPVKNAFFVFMPNYFHQINSRTNLYYQFTTPYKRDFIKWQLGTAYDFTQENIQYSDTFFFRLIKPFTSFSLPLTRRSWLTTDVQLTHNLVNSTGLPRTGYKSTITLFKRVSILSNWSLVGSYSERLMEEDNSLIYQYFKREPFQGLPVTIIIPPTSNAKQFTFDANYSLNIGHTFKLFLNAGIKRLWDQPYFYPQYTIIGFPLTNPIPSPLTFNNQTTNWTNRFYIRYDVLRNMMVDFNYLYTSQLSGNKELMSAIPKHKLTLIINYELPKRFNIWSRNYWQSKTRWYDATNTIPAGEVAYTDLASIFTWDLGVSKRFLKDYLNLNLTFRNLLNGTEKYNPRGAQFDLRIIVGVSCTIDGIFASTPKQ